MYVCTEREFPKSEKQEEPEKLIELWGSPENKVGGSWCPKFLD